MRYDSEIFQKYKNLSVKDVSELVIGETYYSNISSKEFTLVALHTWVEKHNADNANGCSYALSEEEAASQEPAWMLVLHGGNTNSIYESLTDNNIGDSYNPWLIFKDAETAAACRRELIVTFPPHDEYYWDWDEDVSLDDK